ncbi:hypothetical protein [Mycetocola zhadangensis]|uniref:Uncharacterized protein n=1 Tax=Mycetocola zhadangensis TaxID=1164595 RepID=A0A3L7IW29_9MICO|nr:hypothetical protein [Mycetocola zhadangensis]RLQ81252.1 hypothetical protein D9V28_12805 [Mycetocola zhadangensis]GGF03360.1 hypothetical protein GCM10011313_28120 [Mycetocola zhadangensis]
MPTANETADLIPRQRGTSWIAVVLVALVALTLGLVGVIMFGLSGIVIIDGALVEGQSYDPGEASISFAMAAVLGLLCVGALVFIYRYCLAPAMPKRRRVWMTVGIGVLVASLLGVEFVVLLQGRPSSISV